MGSYAAAGLALYNTYLLRQTILKNSIALTRSNNPKIVRPASLVVSGFYFMGLAAVWHIPSLFAELAVRVYCSAENATTTVLFREHLKKEIFNENRV